MLHIDRFTIIDLLAKLILKLVGKIFCYYELISKSEKVRFVKKKSAEA